MRRAQLLSILIQDCLHKKPAGLKCDNTLKIALEEGFGIGNCKEYVEGCPDCRATQIYRKLEQLENSRRP